MAIEIKILGKCSAGTHVRCAIVDTVTGAFVVSALGVIWALIIHQVALK